ncbi:response regulator transcription factor [Sphingomonas rhizophila]|uniref:Response regulator transcription factor n=1 Tax=Sphingomonas rhizophila TaxID=2071607 RepID=A0A7G9SAA6_9SPHN|nr:response regulator transcription factor [Sphingomonas rhizophila]QNN64781.1 response regulator transcription factor [Sphingomonas rhizophila]
MTGQPFPSRILIVEPNERALTVMAKRVAEAGYRVVACDKPTSAMAELHRQPADLVIAELRMPGLSGVELVRMIRYDSTVKETPVILITGRSDASGAIDGFGAGADDVVAKPFDFSVLLARVDRRLARARLIRELREDNAVLDARVITRAIELGEARAALQASEAGLLRLQKIVARSAG